MAFLRALASRIVSWEAEGIHFPVREVRCRYRAVALFDDVLRMTTPLEPWGERVFASAIGLSVWLTRC